MYSSEKPVRVGEVYGLQIIGTGGAGDGLAKYKGFIIFVPETKVGDSVSVRITRIGKSSASGEVVSE